ncbi:MAG TPA: hypothetical protein VE736_12315 [Gaiellaceae bacterium]|nr:hypothetical protein [Gaiellaceae bacterium]
MSEDERLRDEEPEAESAEAEEAEEPDVEAHKGGHTINPGDPVPPPSV